MELPSGETVESKIGRYQQDVEDLEWLIGMTQQMAEDKLISQSTADEECARWAGIVDMINEVIGQLRGSG
jgi:hypothetical protein